MKLVRGRQLQRREYKCWLIEIDIEAREKAVEEVKEAILVDIEAKEKMQNGKQLKHGALVMIVAMMIETQITTTHQSRQQQDIIDFIEICTRI